MAWACYTSFIAGRQRVELYTYDHIDVPDGVTLLCAEDIIPRHSVFQKFGSFAPFSDLFRYTLLHERGGWWVDSDVYYTGKLIPKGDIIFAEEGPGVINNALIKFPQRHPILAEAISRFGKMDMNNIKWGETGPKMLTDLIREQGLDGSAVPADVLYPIHWIEVYKLWLPEFSSYIDDKTITSPFVHLWASTFKRHDWSRPPPSSFMDRIYRRAGVYDRYELKALNDVVIRRKVNKYILDAWVDKYWNEPFFLDLRKV